MGKKLFVGNLPFEANDQDLVEIFKQVGEVASAKIIMDRFTNRSKGFGFVEMATDELAQQAIQQFHGADFNGRAMTVNEARPMEPRENRGPREGGFGGGGRGPREGGGGRGPRGDRGGDRGGFRG
jgi:RNA recognition motif-containing protein